MAARVPLFEGIDDASAVAALTSQLEDIRQVNPGYTTNESLAFRKLRSELAASLSKLRDRLMAACLDPTGMITARGMHRAAQLNPPVVQIRPRTNQIITVAEISPPPTRSPSVVSDTESFTSKDSSQKGKSIQLPLGPTWNSSKKLLAAMIQPLVGLQKSRAREMRPLRRL
jgi:hypothetical protein